MARYEVIARAQVDRRLSSTEYIDMALLAHSLDKGMHFLHLCLSAVGLGGADESSPGRRGGLSADLPGVSDLVSRRCHLS
jgi:hypothetical protein